MTASDPNHGGNLYALVLAAGEARRFGNAKQLAELNGQTLLARMIDAASDVTGDAVSIVIGAHRARVQSAVIAARAAFVINDQWSNGQGSSIGAGIRALPSGCDGVLLVHADQALLSAGHLRSLAERWFERPDHIVVAEYAGTLGVPAIFPRRLFAQLSALAGVHGAKQLVKDDPRCIAIEMAEAAIDVDTVDDLAQLQR